MMLKFGGHAMAAGLSLEEDKFELFQQRLANWLQSGWTLRYCKAKWCQTVVKPGRNNHGSGAVAARC
ncbi:DHHA1 domain-containing protein [Escherichia coli]